MSNITGNTSDGYHTFNELYDHRRALFTIIVTIYCQYAWKSRLHHDGTSYEGWFIVGMDLPFGLGQISYHCQNEKWSTFEIITTKEKAPMWDGHSSQQVVERLEQFATYLQKNII